MLGIIGAAGSGTFLRDICRRAIHPELLVLICLFSTLFSFGFARAPFPYALLPGLGMLAVFTPRGLAFLYAGLGRLTSYAWVRTSIAATFILVLLLFGPILGLLPS